MQVRHGSPVEEGVLLAAIDSVGDGIAVHHTALQHITIHSRRSGCPVEEHTAFQFCVCVALRGGECGYLGALVEIEFRPAQGDGLELVFRVLHMQVGMGLVDTYSIAVMGAGTVGHIRIARYPRAVLLAEDTVLRDDELAALTRLFDCAYQYQTGTLVPHALAELERRCLLLKIGVETVFRSCFPCGYIGHHRRIILLNGILVIDMDKRRTIHIKNTLVVITWIEDIRINNDSGVIGHVKCCYRTLYLRLGFQHSAGAVINGVKVVVKPACLGMEGHFHLLVFLFRKDSAHGIFEIAVIFVQQLSFDVSVVQFQLEMHFVVLVKVRVFSVGGLLGSQRREEILLLYLQCAGKLVVPVPDGR